MILGHNFQVPKLNRLALLICGIFLSLNATSMLAQHRGGRGGGGKNGPTGVSDSETEQSKDFKRAAAIQARPEQITQFQQLTKSDQVARKSAQGILEHAENEDQPGLFHSSKSLTDAVEEAQSENHQFLQSFSDLQKSGLKDFIKKLGKANSDVTKEVNALSRELERSKIDGKQIADIVKRLDKALSDFQAKQVAVGTEMGIQSSS